MVVNFQLDSIKTTDLQHTVMHFLAETAGDKYPFCMTFSDELQHVRRATQGENKEGAGERWRWTNRERESDSG